MALDFVLGDRRQRLPFIVMICEEIDRGTVRGSHDRLETQLDEISEAEKQQD